MAFFNLEKSNLLGTVTAVDTRKVWIDAKSENLKLAKVGGIVVIQTSGVPEVFLVSLVEKVTKSPGLEMLNESTGEENNTPDSGKNQNELSVDSQPVGTEINRVQVVLIGTFKKKEGEKENVFSRSILDFPDISGKCYALTGENLQKLMGIISAAAKGEHALDIGSYTLDEKAKAYLDGNKFFQRHAALLGSTGSGKSWTAAGILEKAKDLPSANVLLFDLHGEYKPLQYAKHLRVAGPDDLKKTAEDVLFLPYWLLNAEEMQAMFIDRSEFSAHNQVLAFQEAVAEEKQNLLKQLGKQDVLNAFTIDSPIPFSLDAVIRQIEFLNSEMTQGSRGLKQGNFYGQFSRLLVRLQSKINDKRYGFLFQPPPEFHSYEALARIAGSLMDFTGRKNQQEQPNQVKVIDFSEVPAEILPVIVGLVARLVYQVQFWMPQDKRQPLVLVCDEAHLYLPKKSETNPMEKRALENFEKIAKEGRKYGVGLFVVSQRPSDVSDTILSQCNNFIILRLTNIDDQSVVRRLLPDGMENFVDVLPILDIGEALVVGDAVLLPTRIKLSPPSEENRPSSATIDFWDEWAKENKKPDITGAVENMRRQSRKREEKK